MDGVTLTLVAVSSSSSAGDRWRDSNITQPTTVPEGQTV